MAKGDHPGEEVEIWSGDIRCGCDGRRRVRGDQDVNHFCDLNDEQDGGFDKRSRLQASCPKQCAHQIAESVTPDMDAAPFVDVFWPHNHVRRAPPRSRTIRDAALHDLAFAQGRLADRGSQLIAVPIGRRAGLVVAMPGADCWLMT